MNSQNRPEKKKLDWPNLPFSYQPTEMRFVAYHDGIAWSKGELTDSKYVTIEEGSTSLHYAQQCFEGMKAYSNKSNDAYLFRPECNAARMARTAKRLLIPEVPEDLFIRGVIETVKANYASVPPHGFGSSLYIRPLLIGIGDNMGLKAAPKYMFRVFCSPVGPYYKSGGLSTIKLAQTDYDRAAPMGLGAFKAGANYAGGLGSTAKAKSLGANEAIYFDAKERKYLDEAGSANIIVHLKDKELWTPKSSSILPSITRESLMIIASEEMGLKTEEKPIAFVEMSSKIDEMAVCGTAAVLTPVSSVLIDDTWYKIGDRDESQPGPVMSELYNRLVDIQFGNLPDKRGWMVKAA